MDIKHEGPRNLAFVLHEANGTISREVVTVASGAGKLEAGTILGTITDGGKYWPSPNAEVEDLEGAETATAILAYGVDATSADAEAVVIARHAEVKEPMLLVHASVDNTAKRTAKLAQLAAVHIIAR